MKLRQLCCIFSLSAEFAYTVPWIFDVIIRRQMEKEREQEYEIQHLSELHQQKYFSGHKLLPMNSGLGQFYKCRTCSHDPVLSGNVHFLEKFSFASFLL